MGNVSSGSEPGEPLQSNPMPRYGPKTWSQWRKTGRRYGMARHPHILELKGRSISSGSYAVKDGQLGSLVVETLGLGGKTEVVGCHKPSGNVIKAPPSVDPSLKLTHLTGNEEPGILSVVFNYE